MRAKLLFVAVLLLAACAPYKMDIRQGNLITPEAREKLKVGMTRTQVGMLLGTPLVSDPFHPNRWDYVYSLEQEKKLVTQQRMTLYFEGDKLVRIDNGNMPPIPVPPAAPAGQDGKQP